MVTIKQILDKKGRRCLTVSPLATIYHALELMAEHDIGALVVTDNDKVVGMFTERDYARKIALHGRSSKDTVVKDMMTTDVVVVSPDKTIDDAMQLMTEFRTRHLPVMEGDHLEGLVSIGDVVNNIIKVQKSTIQNLESYITGSGVNI